MQIIWHGQSCFEIITIPQKNSQIKIVIDPFSEEIGLRIPKLEADIVLTTHNHYDHNNTKAVSPATSESSPFLIFGPGEYEIKNIFIQGITSWHDDKKGTERGENKFSFRNFSNSEMKNTIYTIETEDLKLCHLGDLGQRELTDDQLEKIAEVDILMIPIGGIYTISAKEALKIMSQIEPKITIPMHYALPKLKIKLDGLDKFLKSAGIKSIIPENKLSIKKKDILPEEAKIIVLKP